MIPADPRQEQADKLVLAALPHVPFEGWTARALRLGAQDAGLEPEQVGRLFPRGAAQAVEHFSGLADRRLEEEGIDLSEMKTGPRVGHLVRRRIEAWAGHREAVRRAVSLLAMPGNQPAAIRSAWRTADTIWHLAGDGANDFSWYSRRATLSALFTATLLVWLEDRSEDSAESWAFLDRRLGDIARFGKMRKRLGDRVKGLAQPASDMVARRARRRSFMR